MLDTTRPTIHNSIIEVEVELKRAFMSAAIAASLCSMAASADAQRYYARQKVFNSMVAEKTYEPSDTTKCAALTPKSLSTTVSGPKPRLVGTKYSLLDAQQAIDWCNSIKPFGMKGSCTFFMPKGYASGTAWLYEDLSTEAVSDGDYSASNCS
jgi:hypothetical protein